MRRCWFSRNLGHFFLQEKLVVCDCIFGFHDTVRLVCTLENLCNFLNICVVFLVVGHVNKES